MVSKYPNLFSRWTLRGHEIKNKLIFPPTCPTWINNPWDGIFTDMATDYYRERAAGGVGLIIIGAGNIHKSSIMAPLQVPNLYDDRQIEPLARIADAVHAHGCKLGMQLIHTGSRGFATYKHEPSFDPDVTWHMYGPSQVPLGEFPAGTIPKEMDEEEIEEILECYGHAARRLKQAGLDGVEMHLCHGYLAWQFLSPLYNKRTDKWGGSHENRLRFPVEAMRRMRSAVGEDMFLGYRINSTSFWEGDLEPAEVCTIVQDIERQVDVDYVSVSAGVHHAFIHTPMEFEPGWERGYARAIRNVSSKPVFLVGRITTPDVAESLLASGDGDAICLARQMFADPEWVKKAEEGREDDIRRCVAANYCWKSVSRGGRVQCVYNPTIGREGKWGSGTLDRVSAPKKILIAGGGPSGLEYARIAAARGHEVVIYESERQLGGHSYLQSLLVSRQEYGLIGKWLGEQAVKNGAKVRLASAITADNLDGVLQREAPDHVVIATGSRYSSSGFQGLTAQSLPGWERARCVAWTDVVTGKHQPGGSVVVIDDECTVIAPLCAVGLSRQGADVKLLTRWPMVGMDTILDVYLDWLLPKLYEQDIEIITDHFVEEIRPASLTTYNVHCKSKQRELQADWIVMVTARVSSNELFPLVKQRGLSVELLGDAAAPRGTYEAVYEGHRQARKI